jgi:hypothetical protein
MSIARKGISKPASLTTKSVFLHGTCKMVIKKGSVEKSWLSEVERVQFKEELI